MFPATLVIGLDHFLRGMYFPASVFGVLEVSPWRWLEHTAWVLFCDYFLIQSARQNEAEMREFARQQEALEETNEIIEATIRTRTEQLELETERFRQAETALRHSQKLESVGLLSGGLAHELNTPIQYLGDNLRFIQESFEEINGVLVNAESPQWSDMEFLREEIPQAVAQSLEGVQRVASIVRSIMDYSKGGAKMSPVDLHKVLDSITVMSRNEWKYVAELITEFDPNLPQVTCDRSDMGQVFLNIIVNAAQAIAAGRQAGANGQNSHRHDGQIRNGGGQNQRYRRWHRRFHQGKDL